MGTGLSPSGVCQGGDVGTSFGGGWLRPWQSAASFFTVAFPSFIIDLTIALIFARANPAFPFASTCSCDNFAFTAPRLRESCLPFRLVNFAIFMGGFFVGASAGCASSGFCQSTGALAIECASFDLTVTFARLAGLPKRKDRVSNLCSKLCSAGGVLGSNRGRW